MPAQLGVQASTHHSEVAAATALFLTFLEIGGAVGSGISGAIWTSNVPKKLAMYLPMETKDQASEIFGNITLASTGWPMGSPTRVAINQAYQETMTKILMVAVCVSLPCILLSLLMTDYKLDEIDQGVKGTVIGGAQAKADHGDSEPRAGPSSTRLMSTNGDEDSDEENLVERQDSRSRLLGSRKGS